MLRPFLLFLLLLMPSKILSAQTLPTSAVQSGAPGWQEPPTRISTARLAAGGAAGWAVGVGAGAALGYALGSRSGEGYFGPSELWLGAWVGSSLGTAVGVHFANRQQGNAGWSTLAALAIAPVAAAVVAPTLDSGIPLVIALPAAQVGVSIVVERLRERARRP